MAYAFNNDKSKYEFDVAIGEGSSINLAPDTLKQVIINKSTFGLDSLEGYNIVSLLWAVTNTGSEPPSEYRYGSLCYKDTTHEVYPTAVISGSSVYCSVYHKGNSNKNFYVRVILAKV